MPVISQLMLIFFSAVILIAFLMWALFRNQKGDHDSRYSKSQHYMDFDAGVDCKKVGDPKYPTAGMDSVIKHEFLDELEHDSD